ncbi:hypothetical protein BDZ89DRAFT_1055486 [Hymenopellis radicata]|nr:hypothetical protein BDZ89DRAFT_1055486 [Hymenopellis radicata]
MPSSNPKSSSAFRSTLVSRPSTSSVCILDTNSSARATLTSPIPKRRVHTRHKPPRAMRNDDGAHGDVVASSWTASAKYPIDSVLLRQIMSSGATSKEVAGCLPEALAQKLTGPEARTSSLTACSGDKRSYNLAILVSRHLCWQALVYGKGLNRDQGNLRVSTHSKEEITRIHEQHTASAGIIVKEMGNDESMSCVILTPTFREAAYTLACKKKRNNAECEALDEVAASGIQLADGLYHLPAAISLNTDDTQRDALFSTARPASHESLKKFDWKRTRFIPPSLRRAYFGAL